MYWCAVWPLRVQRWQDLWLDLQIFYLSIHFSSREITQCFTDPVWLSRGSQFRSQWAMPLCVHFCLYFRAQPVTITEDECVWSLFVAASLYQWGSGHKGFNNMQVGCRTYQHAIERLWLLRDKSWKAMEIFCGNRKDKLKTVRPNGKRNISCWIHSEMCIYKWGYLTKMYPLEDDSIRTIP